MPYKVFLSCLSSSSNSALRRCTASKAASDSGLFSESSLMRFSKRSICSRVLCLMARWASLSFALFLASCSAFKVVTLRVPALEAGAVVSLLFFLFFSLLLLSPVKSEIRNLSMTRTSGFSTRFALGFVTVSFCLLRVRPLSVGVIWHCVGYIECIECFGDVVNGSGNNKWVFAVEGPFGRWKEVCSDEGKKPDKMDFDLSKQRTRVDI